MLKWTEAQLTNYFESGGEEMPAPCDVSDAPTADLAALEMCQKLAPEIAESEQFELESARSSVDGWVAGGRDGASEAPTVPYADLQGADEYPLGEDMGAEMIDDELEAGGAEERTEDALLDADPMAQVPVSGEPTRRPAAAYPGDAAATSSSGGAAEEEDDGVGSWSVKQLKEFLTQRGVDVKQFSEKREFILEVRRLKKVEAASGASSPGNASSNEIPAASSGGGQPSAKLARLIRKIEDIKSTGDTAFKAKDFEKADRHYTSCLQRAAESDEPLPSTLLGSIFSNRSGARETLNRHAEALEDGRMAVKHRKGWPRAYCRVGAALISLRRLEEARTNYEDGLKCDPGSSELQSGLSEVLKRLGKSAGGSEAAAAAKAKGNAAFKDGKLEEALAAYNEAVRCAPSDETLYSNRSATLAKLERYNEALADGKRAVSIRPEWGKGYSRAGLAALNGGDEESAYWFYSNGLKRDPSNSELLKGRDACIRQLMQVDTARYKRRIERYKRDAERPPARVFAVSDVHYDHPGAKEWAANLSKTAYKNDAIIVAGDVGDTFVAVKYCLKAFKAAFRRVFYVPGNHDMWIRPAGQHSNEPSMFADSVEKLLQLWKMCDELDVDTGPAMLSPKCTVVPLDAWYSCTFDHFDPRPGQTLFDKFCKWPMHYDAVWEFMTGLNEPRLQIVEKENNGKGNGKNGVDVITFSHFLPRKELPLPGVHEMAKASGCLKVEEQLRRVKSSMHVFGHTHINTQNDYDGCTYIQNAMGYGISPGQKLCVVHDQGRFKQYMA